MLKHSNYAAYTVRSRSGLTTLLELRIANLLMLRLWGNLKKIERLSSVFIILMNLTMIERSMGLTYSERQLWTNWKHAHPPEPCITKDRNADRPTGHWRESIGNSQLSCTSSSHLQPSTRPVHLRPMN